MALNRKIKPLILYPTDFSIDGEAAFAHALKLSLKKQTGVHILHVDRPGAGPVNWADFPPVREMLVRWGLLEPDASRSALFDQLGIMVDKVEMRGKSIVDAIKQFRKQHLFGIDMMVIATAGREGLPHWLHPSIAEHVAREVNIPTLFVPNSATTWVDVDDGEISLGQILIPVDHEPLPQLSIAATTDLVRDLDIRSTQVTVLHVGDESAFPDVDLPNDEHCEFQRVCKTGNPVGSIVDVADELQAQLIVMATQGHDGFLDVLRGSVSERVLRAAPCPVLTIPVNT